MVTSFKHIIGRKMKRRPNLICLKDMKNDTKVLAVLKMLFLIYNYYYYLFTFFDIQLFYYLFTFKHSGMLYT